MSNDCPRRATEFTALTGTRAACATGFAAVRRRSALEAMLVLAAGLAGPAAALDKPGGPVVLTVTGRVAKPNEGTSANFDMKMLAELPQARFTTRTPWYAQAREFSGPLLRDVLAAAGARGSTIRARALNDYWVDIPFEDSQRFDVILARLLDGKPMAVREKGPLFIVYPFDSQPELRNTTYYSRSAWQLRTIEVR